MLRFLNVEFKKILPYKAMWIFIGLYLLMLPAILGIFKNFQVNGSAFDISKVYSFPGIWNNLTYIGSYFHIIPGFLIIMLMGNEYTYRTLRQNIITGYSRLDFVTGKTIVIAIISLALTIYLLILGLIYGSSYTNNLNPAQIFEKIYLIPVFALQTFAYMMLAFFITILIKRSALSMILFLLYVLLIEKIIRNLVPEKIAIYFPAKTFSDLIPFPQKELTSMMGIQWSEHTLPIAIILTIGYCGLLFYLSYYTLSKRDL